MIEQGFANQVAIITGAGEGIGYEIARQLSLAGANVLLNDIHEQKAQQAAENIRQAGGECFGVGGDAGDVAVIRQMVTQVVEAYGKLDMAIANAGLTSWGDFFSYEPENFDRVTGVNLRGSFFLVQAAAQQMRQQGTGGRILLMSSVTGHQAIRYLAAYSMTKAALEMLAKNLVIELSPYQITINAIAPGATLTPRNIQDDPQYESVWGNLIPTGRIALPEDIADAALFLLSPQARQITGQTIVVDGGWTAISPTPTLDFVEAEES